MGGLQFFKNPMHNARIVCIVHAIAKAASIPSFKFFFILHGFKMCLGAPKLISVFHLNSKCVE
jgi:hypothetical protein